MTRHASVPQVLAFQRARGAVSVTVQQGPASDSRLQNLRQEGSYRVVFPRPSTRNLEAVIVNTAGGVTGGDAFRTHVVAGADAGISVTTQAAERIYRAPTGEAGRIASTLTVANGAQIFWLPQETILFDGCKLDRRLVVDVAVTGRFLMVEPLVFGRAASGEVLRDCAVRDSVTIRVAGRPAYVDCIRLDGDIAAIIQRGAVAANAQAMASVVLVDRLAAQHLDAVRDLLPDTAGASLLAENILVIRILAADSFALRTGLLPLLKQLSDNAVPKNWRL